MSLTLYVSTQTACSLLSVLVQMQQYVFEPQVHFCALLAALMKCVGLPARMKSVHCVYT